MFCVFVIVIKKIKKMQKWIWCISFFDLSESSSSSNTLDFRKHQLPASQISPGLILHEFPNCSSRDWRRSAATVQQSQKKKQKKKHWQHYNGFILHMTSWRSFWSWLHSEVVVQKKSLSYIFVKKKKKKAQSKTMKLLHQTETSVRFDSYSCLFMSRET